MGMDNARDLARQFAAVLYDVGFTTVVPVKSYELLERSLLSGDVHAAWGPPMVCARLEGAGAEIALSAVRNGSTSYRSALICRAHDDLSIAEIGQRGLRRLRAVWVDEHSMGGCVLARHHLRAQGIDLATAFESEKMLGSYKACFEAVMDCDADITASYANARGLGYVEICGGHAYHLRTLAYTAECQNDGVVISPTVKDTRDIKARFASLLENPGHRAIFCEALNVDDLTTPAPGAYRNLLPLMK